MKTKATIAVIGNTNNSGTEFLRHLGEGNYRLLLFDQEDMCLEMLCPHSAVEMEVINCATDACWEADIVVLAIATTDKKAIAEKIRRYVTQKTIIHISSNNEDSQELQKLLPDAVVIKVFDSKHVVEHIKSYLSN